MAMIVTTYTADGKKIRKPMGYAGAQCQRATAPYEEREISGQTKKAPTDEGYLPDPEVEVEERTKIGG